MKLKDVFNQESVRQRLKAALSKGDLRQKLAWVTKNAVVLLLAANLIMSLMTYRKAEQASEHARWAVYTAEQAHSAAEEASAQAREAAEAAHDADDSAERVASEVSSLRLSMLFR